MGLFSKVRDDEGVAGQASKGLPYKRDQGFYCCVVGGHDSWFIGSSWHLEKELNRDRETWNVQASRGVHDRCWRRYDWARAFRSVPYIEKNSSQGLNRASESWESQLWPNQCQERHWDWLRWTSQGGKCLGISTREKRSAEAVNKRLDWEWHWAMIQNQGKRVQTRLSHDK